MEWFLAIAFSALVISASQQEPPPPETVDAVVNEPEPDPLPVRCPDQRGGYLSRNLTQPFQDALYMTSDNTICQMPREWHKEEPPRHTREQVH